MRLSIPISIALVGCLGFGCTIQSGDPDEGDSLFGNDGGDGGSAGDEASAGNAGDEASAGNAGDEASAGNAGAAGDEASAGTAAEGGKASGRGGATGRGGSTSGVGGKGSAGDETNVGGNAGESGEKGGAAGEGTAGSAGESGGTTITATAAGGPWHAAATWIGGVVPGPDDDAVISGEVTVDLSSTGATATCRNLMVGEGMILRSEPYGYRTVIVHGDLTNEGTVRDGPGMASYDDANLTVEIGGEFLQAGSYAVIATRFIGTETQRIGVGAESGLSGAFVDEDPTSSLVASSDLTINGATLTLTSTETDTGTLALGEYELTLESGDFRVVGGVLKVSSITGVEGATLTVDHLAATTDTIELGGDVPVSAATIPEATDTSIPAGGLIRVDGSVHVLSDGVLYNQSYTDPTMAMSGGLVNDGIVRAGPGYAAYGSASLSLLLSGELAQNGSYTPTATHFTGATDQTISVGASSYLTGTFVDDDPGSRLVAGSAISSRGITLTLGTAEGAQGALDMGDYGLSLDEGNLRIVSGALHASQITGVLGASLTTDQIVVTSSVLELFGDIPVSATTTDATLAPEGARVNVVSVAGSVHVNADAALYNQGYTDPTVAITGSLVNDGIVRAGPGYAAYGSNTFTVQVEGALTVNGAYTPTSTTFVGDTEQTLTLGADTTLSGAFTDATPSSALVAGSDLVVTDLTLTLGTAEESGALNMASYALSEVSGTLTLVNGSLTVDNISCATLPPAEAGQAAFVLPQITPPSGTLTLDGYCAVSSSVITGNLVVSTVLFNPMHVTSVITVSGTVTGDGIVGSGPGYASYDSGSMTLNGLLADGW